LSNAPPQVQTNHFHLTHINVCLSNFRPIRNAAQCGKSASSIAGFFVASNQIGSSQGVPLVAPGECTHGTSDASDVGEGAEALALASAQHIGALAFRATNGSVAGRDPQPIEFEPQSPENFDWSMFADLPPDIQVLRL
jgi:hypothetical protein